MKKKIGRSILGRLKSHNMGSPRGTVPVEKIILYVSLEDQRHIEEAVERVPAAVSAIGNRNGKAMAFICREWLKGRK